ncbi:MAG: hypothetical protein ACOX6G_10610 [Christensenellales bacterium]|jgi:hypothetical protein
MNQPMNPVPEISMDGFQLVSSEMFREPSRRYDATCTIWHDSIAFSKVSVTSLNGCERVLLKVNPEDKRILIIPCTIKDKDAIRWTKYVKEPVPRKMDCRSFASRLYQMWNWKKDFVYRTSGRLVTSDKKVMLLFDFSSPESWQFKAKEAQ